MKYILKHVFVNDNDKVEIPMTAIILKLKIKSTRSLIHKNLNNEPKEIFYLIEDTEEVVQ